MTAPELRHFRYFEHRGQITPRASESDDPLSISIRQEQVQSLRVAVLRLPPEMAKVVAGIYGIGRSTVKATALAAEMRRPNCWISRTASAAIARLSRELGSQ